MSKNRDMKEPTFPYVKFLTHSYNITKIVIISCVLLCILYKCLLNMHLGLMYIKYALNMAAPPKKNKFNQSPTWHHNPNHLQPRNHLQFFHHCEADVPLGSATHQEGFHQVGLPTWKVWTVEDPWRSFISMNDQWMIIVFDRNYIYKFYNIMLKKKQ